jgi:hypothetical protein
MDAEGMMRGLVFALAATLLAGCASVEKEMASYVGRPIQEAFVDRGVPRTKFAMPDGSTARSEIERTSTGATVETQIAASSIPFDCIRTLFAKTGDDGVERVVGYRTAGC